MEFQIKSEKFMRFIKPYKKDIKAPFYFDNEGGLSFKDDLESNSDGYNRTIVRSKTKIAELLTDMFISYSEEWKDGKKISENKSYIYIANCISNWKMVKGTNKFYDDVEYFSWKTDNVNGAFLKGEEWHEDEVYGCSFEFKDGNGKYSYERYF